MRIPQLKLLPRLLLASLVLPAALLLYQMALLLYPEGNVLFGYLWYSFAPPFYDIPFALLVLAPFITTTRWRWMRAIALVIVTAIVYFAAVLVVSRTRGELLGWIDSPYLTYVNLVPTALVATLLLAGATAWLGALRISLRYWICTGLAGLVTGIVFLSFYIIDEYTRDYGDELRYYLAYWFWPVATCLAIYRGRDPERTG